MNLVYKENFLTKLNHEQRVTATRKAGKELKERISSLLPNTSLGFISIFHVFSIFFLLN